MPRATPQHIDDKTSYKDYKPELAGSGIKVEPMPPSKGGTKEDFMGKSKPNPKDITPIPLSKATKEDYMGTSKPSKKADADIVPLASGGTASSRADGCCVKGKTRGKMM
tara:strand:+ start:869 stop:1195 length:327 start_codon:yes stop_codon:yes gene_type:complete